MKSIKEMTNKLGRILEDTRRYTEQRRISEYSIDITICSHEVITGVVIHHRIDEHTEASIHFHKI